MSGTAITVDGDRERDLDGPGGGDFEVTGNNGNDIMEKP